MEHTENSAESHSLSDSKPIVPAFTAREPVAQKFFIQAPAAQAPAAQAPAAQAPAAQAADSKLAVQAQEPVTYNEPQTRNMNDYSQEIGDIDSVHKILLGGINKAKQVHEDLHMHINLLKKDIEKKQQEKEVLRKDIEAGVNASQQSGAFIIPAPLFDHDNDNEAELSACYADLKEYSCERIIDIAEKIRNEVSSDFDGCQYFIDDLDQEMKLMRAKISYIRTLKEMDVNMKLYKELAGREEKLKARFRALSEIFSLDIKN